MTFDSFHQQFAATSVTSVSRLSLRWWQNTTKFFSAWFTTRYLPLVKKSFVNLSLLAKTLENCMQWKLKRCNTDKTVNQVVSSGTPRQFHNVLSGFETVVLNRGARLPRKRQ